MCGIVGFWQREDSFDAHSVLKKMSDSIIHRGPDDSGVWFDEETKVALGQRRLSIVDLSPMGHQPMVSSSGRYIIVFNGEIYNFNDIRKEIIKKRYGAFSFRGTSDTEVMLEAFECFGIESSLKKFVGMFAFAVFDRKDKKMHISRDRIGEKPLYYGVVGSSFVFSSELKAFYVFPKFSFDIDRDALSLYFRHCFIPAPYTVFKNVKKLLPGTILTLDWREGTIPEACSYWSMENAISSGLENQFKGNEDEAANELEKLIMKSISGQMIADVPLGAFLSGGVDSSLVVSLMQSQSSKPIKTFTIGFGEKGFNEAEEAKKVAEHLGTDHTELYVSHKEAIEVIEHLPHLYDEPFADSSQIPTYLVSKLARSKVTVSLSGDAGDELFCGYNRYFLAEKIINKSGRLPFVIGKALPGIMKGVSIENWNRIFRLISSNKDGINFGDKIYKLSDVLRSKNAYEIYLGLSYFWNDTSSLVIGSNQLEMVNDYKGEMFKFQNVKEWMMYFDTKTYLPDDILVKVDRASMGVSLESRIPLLDHRIIEFACSIPIGLKVKNGQGKWLLRQILYKYVPKDLIERPKKGFAVPIGEWVRGPLKDWAAQLLDEKRLREEGYLNPELVSKVWKEHLEGIRDWKYQIWGILMFQQWLEDIRAKKIENIH